MKNSEFLNSINVLDICNISNLNIPINIDEYNFKFDRIYKKFDKNTCGTRQLIELLILLGEKDCYEYTIKHIENIIEFYFEIMPNPREIILEDIKDNIKILDKHGIDNLRQLKYSSKYSKSIYIDKKKAWLLINQSSGIDILERVTKNVLYRGVRWIEKDFKDNRIRVVTYQDDIDDWEEQLEEIHKFKLLF